MTLLFSLHILVSVFLIVIILLQQGKGADVGATFGGGGNSVFGAAGADNLLTKVTAIGAFVFMLTSLFLAVGQKPSIASQSGVFQNLPSEADNSGLNVIDVDAPGKPAVATESSEESDTIEVPEPSAVIPGKDVSAEATSSSEEMVKEGAEAVMDKAGDAATQAAGSVSDAASDVVSEVGDAAGSMVDKVQDAGASVVSEVKEVVEEAAESVTP